MIVVQNLQLYHFRGNFFDRAAFEPISRSKWVDLALFSSFYICAADHHPSKVRRFVNAFLTSRTKGKTIYERFRKQIGIGAGPMSFYDTLNLAKISHYFMPPGPDAPW